MEKQILNYTAEGPSQVAVLPLQEAPFIQSQDEKVHEMEIIQRIFLVRKPMVLRSLAYNMVYDLYIAV